MLAALMLSLSSVGWLAAPWVHVEGPARLEVHGPNRNGSRLQVDLSNRLRIELSVEGSETMEVEPIKNLVEGEGWQVETRSSTTTVSQNGKRRWSQTFWVEPWRAPGNTELQLATFRFRVAADKPVGELRWPAVPVEVVTRVEQVDPAVARDVADIETDPPVPASDLRPYWVTAGFAIGAVLLLGATLWLRRRRVAVPLSPRERALRELALLATLPLPCADPAWHATRVSALVRAFLDQQYNLATAHQTTAEVRMRWRNEPKFPIVLSEQVLQLLEACDLARFTGIAPTAAESQRLIDTARDLIDSATTAPLPAPTR